MILGTSSTSTEVGRSPKWPPAALAPAMPSNTDHTSLRPTISWAERCPRIDGHAEADLTFARQQHRSQTWLSLVRDAVAAFPELSAPVDAIDLDLAIHDGYLGMTAAKEAAL